MTNGITTFFDMTTGKAATVRHTGRDSSRFEVVFGNLERDGGFTVTLYPTSKSLKTPGGARRAAAAWVDSDNLVDTFEPFTA